MSERRMTDTMWEAAKLLWNNDVPGWMIAQHYEVSISCIYRRANADDTWKDRSRYADRRISPDRRTARAGGRRLTDQTPMRCQECQQRYTGSHVCSGRRIA